MKSRDSLIRFKRFQVDEKRRQVMQIEQMIAEFNRMATDLEKEIQAEQERTGITDVTHYAYPTYARAAHQRMENLKGSADNLQSQLEDAQDALNEAVEELKKVEMIDQRDNQRDKQASAAAEQQALEEAHRNRRGNNDSAMIG
jgi:flagellar FliJ protein